jgi:hypothetical protein
MSTDHRGGNIQNEITVEEHDGTNNAKRVNVVAGGGTGSSTAAAAALALSVTPSDGWINPNATWTFATASTSKLTKSLI